MNLKRILQRHGLMQKTLARALELSSGSVAQLLNHSQWPKSIPAEQIKEKTRQFLVECGVSQKEIDSAFEETGSKRANTPTLPFDAHSDKEQLMLLRRQGLYQASKKHFGLPRDPFSDDVSSHDDVFISPDIRYVREAMYQTARHGGFMAIVGESGAGKSTLRRDLADRIIRESLPIIVIEPYVLGMEDNDLKGKTLKSSHIAEAILNTITPLESARRSPEARFRQVHKALRESHRAGNRHVLLIEEAHGMPIPTIKHLKRFFELEDGFQKLLSIILLGQPELRLKLSETNQEVREVVQRCEVVELAPLDTRLEEYLKFKFDRVGIPLPKVIDTSGVEAIRSKLTLSGNHRGDAGRRNVVSLLYPLAVGNLLTACMNLAAELGVPIVNGDVVKGV
ncbi:MAG: AAA family ATPase [Burkholderiaceae bacterium]|jgi:type II secretory pathway predicted ATPase ExeA|nr:AAA family ATPase [Burkholderiaceae bacterium]